MEHIHHPLVVGLVTFKIGTYKQVMEMDIEDAINTFYIHYTNRFNENYLYERSALESRLKK